MPRKKDEQPYSKVVREMWGDQKFTRLSALKPSGQGLWLYLLTGPHCTVIPGLFPNMGIGTLADRLKWPYATVERLWQEIADEGMGEADWSAGVIWLPKAITHNDPANPNVVTSWRNVPLPQCDLVVRALRLLRQRLSLKQNHAWVEAFDEVFRKGFPQALPEGSGESGSGTGTGIDLPPQPPAVAGGVVVTRADRKEAETIRGNRDCDHTPVCETRSICIEYIAAWIATKRADARRAS